MTLAYYFVAFIDLLGQSDQLALLRSLPNTDEEKKATIAIMKETGGVVRNVRNSFKEYFAASKEMSPSALASVPPERREEFKQIRDLKVFQTGFSDSFVVCVPLQVEDGNEPIGLARAANDVWNALVGIAGLSLVALSQGVALRAGIDAGLAMEIFPNEVYGPVLLSAYRLESQVAEYPRAAVGEGLLAYLTFLEQRRVPGQPLTEYTANIARHCRDLICAAPDDGWPMLHFLSDHIPTGAPSARTDRQAAESWLRGEIKRYHTERNEKLARRYVRLARYFQAYATPAWQVIT